MIYTHCSVFVKRLTSNLLEFILPGINIFRIDGFPVVKIELIAISAILCQRPSQELNLRPALKKFWYTKKYIAERKKHSVCLNSFVICK
jgi:hypothetical protein